MLAGIIFIVAGVLIAIYPPQLSIIVAALLILVGVVVLTMPESLGQPASAG